MCIRDSPSIIQNASEENIGIENIKDLLGYSSNKSLPMKVKNVIEDDYSGIYSEKNVREVMWDLDINKTDKAGNKLGKSSLEESKAKEEEIQILMNNVTQASNNRISFDQRNKLSNEDKKDLKEFKIVSDLAYATEKDLAILKYMRAAGFENKIEAETALASIDTGELPINNKL